MQSTCIRNRYQLQKIIGRGRSSIVHLAFDKRIKRHVAIKQICRSNTPNYDKVVKKLQREYRFLNEISHINIIKAYDFFQEDANCFFVMEYVKGLCLDKYIVNHPWSLDLVEQLAIAIQISQAITQINSVGLLHRDIKPQNIIINQEDGTVKLLDLGISKSLHSNLHTLTKTLAIQGKVAYMSPERMDGVEYHNSDVFSLAAVLYQFFSWSRRSPFAGKNVFSTIDKVQQYSPPPITNYMYSTSQESYQQLSLILTKALQKNAQKRTVSVQKLMKELVNLYQAFPHIGSKWFVDITGVLPKRDSKRIDFFSNARKLRYAIISVICLTLFILMYSIVKKSTHVPLQNNLSKNYFEKSLESYYFASNYDKAWEQNEKAIIEDIHNAKYLFHKAKMLFHGHGTQQNQFLAHKIAEKQLTILAKNTDAYSMYFLGYMYQFGIGTKKSDSRAMRWYKKAADLQNPIAMNNLAVYYGAQRKYVDAFLLLQKASELNLPIAKTNLGMRYLNGSGVIRNYQKAISLFQQAADAQYPQAMEQLGVCYYNGYGVNKNYIEAANWFRKAALKNQPHAIFCLGFCYENGYGVKQDKKEAINWYKKAAKYNNEQAKKRLKVIDR